ncbi:MAG: ABC transporter permease subunit [Deltaproteobacteria bacterium]|nr:ABC transporter permease subunit [Deltaproteobacteria bacterium]
MIFKVWAIALNTFREAVRDRVLYGVLFFATAILLFTLALAELSLSEQRRVVMDVGLASISLFSVVIAVFLGSSLLYKEIEKKTLYVILPKPLRRSTFLLGKYVGISLTGATFIGLMGAVQFWVAAIQADADPWLLVAFPIVLGAVLAAALVKARDRTAVLVPFSLVALAGGVAVAATTDADIAIILSSLVLSAGEVMVVAAVALLFSSFSTPFLTGAFTLGFWLVGRSADDMANMPGSVLGEEVKASLGVLAEVVPNFNLFVPGRNTLVATSETHGGPWLYVAETMGYASLYTVVVLALAALIFRRRDFL